MSIFRQILDNKVVPIADGSLEVVYCDKNFSLKIIPTAISSRTPVLGLHHKMNCTFHFTHSLIQLAVRMFIHSKKHGSSKPFAEEKKGPAHMALRPLLLFFFFFPAPWEKPGQGAAIDVRECAT